MSKKKNMLSQNVLQASILQVGFIIYKNQFLKSALPTIHVDFQVEWQTTIHTLVLDLIWCSEKHVIQSTISQKEKGCEVF